MVIHLTDFLQYMWELKFYDEFIVTRIAHEKEKEGQNIRENLEKSVKIATIY